MSRYVVRLNWRGRSSTFLLRGRDDAAYMSAARYPHPSNALNAIKVYFAKRWPRKWMRGRPKAEIIDTRNRLD